MMKRWLFMFMICSPAMATTPAENAEMQRNLMHRFTCSQVSEVASKDQEDLLKMTKLLAIGWFQRTHRPLGDKELLMTAKYCRSFPNWTWDEVLDVMATGPSLK